MLCGNKGPLENGSGQKDLVGVQNFVDPLLLLTDQGGWLTECECRSIVECGTELRTYG